MLPPPDPRTLMGQIRICHNQASMTVSTLALALDQAAQLAIALHGPDSPNGQTAARRDAANLLRLMDSANTTIEQAHAAARDFCAIILVCRGAA